MSIVYRKIIAVLSFSLHYHSIITYLMSTCTRTEWISSRVRAGNFVIFVMPHLPVPYVCKCMGILLLPFFFFFFSVPSICWSISGILFFFSFYPSSLVLLSSSLPSSLFPLSFLLLSSIYFKIFSFSGRILTESVCESPFSFFLLFVVFCLFRSRLFLLSQSIAGVIFGFLSS